MQQHAAHSFFRSLRSLSAGRTLCALIVAFLTLTLTSCRFTQAAVQSPTLLTPQATPPTTVLQPDVAEATDTPPQPPQEDARTPQDESHVPEAKLRVSEAADSVANTPTAQPQATTSAPKATAATPKATTSAPKAPTAKPKAIPQPKATAPKPSAPAPKAPETTPQESAADTTAPTPQTPITAPSTQDIPQASNNTEMLTTNFNILIIVLLLVLLVVAFLFWKATRRSIDETLHIANEARGKALTALSRYDSLMSSSNATTAQPAPAVTDNTAAETATVAAETASSAMTAANTAAAEAAEAREIAQATQQTIDDLCEKEAATRQTVQALSDDSAATNDSINALTAQLEGIFAKINEATENLQETNLKIAKLEERLQKQETELSQLNSTQKPSKKAASHASGERDLFAENGFQFENPETPTENIPRNNSAENAKTSTTTTGRNVLTILDLNEAKDRPAQFLEHLQDSYPAFFDILTQHGPSLTKRDMMLATLIALKTPKEQLLQTFALTPESLKAARYRIRTKLSLERKENLDETLHSWI